MLDSLSVQGWLLILIGLAGFRASKFVYRDIKSYRTFGNFEFNADRDPDRSRSFRFWVCVAALVALAASAIFVLTPQADALAQSPVFLLSAAAAWAGAQGANEVLKGEARPFGSRWVSHYRRADQPGQYWMAVAFNFGLAAISAYMAFHFWHS